MRDRDGEKDRPTDRQTARDRQRQMQRQTLTDRNRQRDTDANTDTDADNTATKPHIFNLLHFEIETFLVSSNASTFIDVFKIEVNLISCQHNALKQK